MHCSRCQIQSVTIFWLYIDTVMRPFCPRCWDITVGGSK
jgi:hypothetical protein